MSQLLQLCGVDAGHLAEARYEHGPSREVLCWALVFRKCRAEVAGVVLDDAGKPALADVLAGFAGYRVQYRMS